MIIEYTYSPQDLRKKCYGCNWLKLEENEQFYGFCTCNHNKVKNCYRCVTDKACSWKNADYYEKGK